MPTMQQRATVGQDHLDRSAAIIDKLSRRRRRAPKTETLDGKQRYAFVEMYGELFALKARLGSKIGIVCGGIGYAVRVPRTQAEKAAVLRAEAMVPANVATKPISTVARMANKMVEVAVAGRAIARLDFHQCGVADADINPNFEAAVKLARRIEPRLDQMVAA